MLAAAAAAAKSLQSCLTLCDPIDGSPPGSSVRGILQARTLEWVAISFSIHTLRSRYKCYHSRGPWASQVVLVIKNPPARAGDRDVGSIPGLRRSPGEGNDNPLQYSCLENPTDRRIWWAIVHVVAESDMTEGT